MPSISSSRSTGPLESELVSLGESADDSLDRSELASVSALELESEDEDEAESEFVHESESELFDAA
jgi:hypothetical protein